MCRIVIDDLLLTFLTTAPRSLRPPCTFVPGWAVLGFVAVPPPASSSAHLSTMADPTRSWTRKRRAAFRSEECHYIFCARRTQIDSTRAKINEVVGTAVPLMLEIQPRAEEGRLQHSRKCSRMSLAPRVCNGYVK